MNTGLGGYGGGSKHVEQSPHDRASLIAQLVKNPPAMQEFLVLRFLGQEDPLEKG